MRAQRDLTRSPHDGSAHDAKLRPVVVERGSIEPRTAREAERLRTGIEAARRGWAERGEAEFETGYAFGDGERVRIRLRRRGRRYDLSDGGAAVRKAGARGSTWLRLAERVVAEQGFNVNRKGVVFVPAVEGRDLARLAARLAETSFAVYAALLDAEADRESGRAGL